MPLLSLPDELLNKIVINTDLRTGSRHAVRLTCKNLCDVATPLVFEHFYINFTRMQSDKSHAIRFLKELSQGRRLARFIRALYFRIVPADIKSHSKDLTDALKSLWKNGWHTFYGTVGKLFVAAVPQMVALERIYWKTIGKTVLPPKIADQIIHSLSNHPRIRSVAIFSFGIDRDIPCAPFRGLTYLTIRESCSLNYAPAIIANSPNLFRLVICMDMFPSAPPFPVLSLFGAFPNGTYSAVQEIILSGRRFSLEPTTVPALVPHLRNLSEFHMPVGFDVPDEFWIALCDAGVFLQRTESKIFSRLRNSFLSYLGACRDLHEVHLRLGRINACHEQDEQRAQFFLYNIVAMNSGSLTVILLQPDYAGCWCLDAPMLQVLLLCAHLVYIGISVDKESAQIKYKDNIITKLLHTLRHWEFLQTLDIGTAIPVNMLVHPASPVEHHSMEEVSADITRCVENFNCRDPTPQMLQLRIHTDSRYGLQLQRQDFRSPIHKFDSSEVDARATQRARGTRSTKRSFAILSSYEMDEH